MRLVLRENADPQIAGVDEIGQHEIDQPVGAAEGNRGLGPVRGQRIQPLALTAGQDDAQHVWPLPSWLKPIGRREPLPGGTPIGRVLTGCPSRYLVIRQPMAADPAGESRRPSPSTVRSMRVAMMTREYPPEVYGGAGVHVTELVAQLRRLCAVDVHCMGAPRPGAFAHQPDPRLHGANAALSTLSSDLVMANAVSAATVAHSHTWYTGMAGHLAAMLYDIPHVLTAHSLEPLRPWKAEQLGGGYRVSTWVEHTAVLGADAIIAVSTGMREDMLRVYPALDPEPGARHPQRDRHRRVVPGRAGAHRLRAGRTRRRPEPADRGVRRADHPAEGRRPPGGGRTPVQPRGAVGAVRRRARHPGDRRGSADRGGRTGPQPHRRVLDPGHAPHRKATRNTLGSNSFRVPVGV